MASSADLNWTELADSVWLAAAITPPPTAGEARPAQELMSDRDTIAIRNVPSEPRDIPPPPEPQDAPITAPVVPKVENAVLVIEADTPPAEQREPAVLDTRTGEIALADSLEYFRALRGLKREAISRRDNDVVLDEEATAVRAAET
jgi:hypothetical protein